MHCCVQKVFRVDTLPISLREGFLHINGRARTRFATKAQPDKPHFTQQGRFALGRVHAQRAGEALSSFAFWREVIFLGKQFFHWIRASNEPRRMRIFYAAIFFLSERSKKKFEKQHT